MYQYFTNNTLHYIHIAYLLPGWYEFVSVLRWMERVPAKSQVRHFVGKTLKFKVGEDGFDLISAESLKRRIPVDAIGRGVYVVNDYIRRPRVDV